MICICNKKSKIRASLVAQRLKPLPAMRETWETWVQSLGQGDPLEKEMATHSSIIIIILSVRNNGTEPLFSDLVISLKQ